MLNKMYLAGIALQEREHKKKCRYCIHKDNCSGSWYWQRRYERKRGNKIAFTILKWAFPPYWYYIIFRSIYRSMMQKPIFTPKVKEVEEYPINYCIDKKY